MITIRQQGFKTWFYRHCPGKINEVGHIAFDHLTPWDGILQNWRTFQVWCPLLTLLHPWWWRMVTEDRREGFKTCGCGRTWFTYRLLPALVGSTRFGGGC